ncbi:hypothetical protein Agabi119p4_7380 [Agaricus bisporus var. burnettii]|uniref:Uncharacterized protein n=1 Tax=Agaricus bisporus var. burnettii TaxID=192524 RepID=A0A8H7C7H6_AGABI|nr:hypothetical protein Agabi119p4_7380 [Agaricus bisporus var. burnettii]
MLLRNIPRLGTRFPHSRWQSTNSSSGRDEDSDFRPSWVYVTSRLVNFTVIPCVMLYSVFFYDFGDKDHVFKPVRRWAQEQKAAFLTLSPDEKRVLETNTSSET